MTTIAKYFGLAVPYGSFVCLAYLFGYWVPFNVNVLEHIGFPDIARLSLYPVLMTFFSFVLGAAVGQILIGDRLPPGGGARSRMSQFVFRYWVPILALYIAGIGAVVILGQEPEKWRLVAILAAFLSTPLSHADLATEMFPSPRVRAFMLFVLLWAPGWAFASGRSDAYQIKAGRAETMVDVARLGVPVQSDATHPVFYVGFVGGRFALYESLSGNIVLVREESVESLALVARNASRTMEPTR
jgi:hypothetical protein